MALVDTLSGSTLRSCLVVFGGSVFAKGSATVVFCFTSSEGLMATTYDDLYPWAPVGLRRNMSSFTFDQIIDQFC